MPRPSPRRRILVERPVVRPGSSSPAPLRHPEAFVSAQASLTRWIRANPLATKSEREAHLAQSIREHDDAVEREERARTIYAMRMLDGNVKIGSTDDVDRRRRELKAVAVMAISPGGYRMERRIHRLLAAHRVVGLETYRPTPLVTQVVQQIQDGL